jgi:CRISPR-associated endonuclease/helicase Cas3
VCHALDVGHVAGRLWNRLRKPLQLLIANALGLDPVTAARWISFWIAAHDIGKLTPCFQLRGAQTDKLRQHLTDAFDCPACEPKHHTETGTKILRDELACGGDSWPAMPELATKVAVAVGGHHGTFPTSWNELRAVLGNGHWASARRELLTQLASTFGVSNDSTVPRTVGPDQSVWILLAGLTAVADWIGSNETFFPWTGGPLPLDLTDYIARSDERAMCALWLIGWARPDPDPTPRTFADVTGLKDIPRPLQQQVIDLLGHAPTTAPQLFLIEAPMGEGKTEAAWYVADCWDRAGGAGTYVALPTMATSNQMFERVEKFLKLSGGGNLMLMHGKATLNDQFEKLKYTARVYDPDGNTSGVVAESWFANDKKQAMLAPFGVGTIDQALLSVLQTKHGFVRLFGLTGKCVILDEVHAYDAYMTTLLERLLRWLAALGCPVVLLSATLPADKREKLLAAYSGNPVTPKRLDTSEDGWGAYPRLVRVGVGVEAAEVRNFAADPSRDKKIRLSWVEDDNLPRNIKDKLGNGGCVAVIRNTVGLAQDTYLRLKEVFADTDVAVELFHARFPFGRRKQIEDEVLEKYGKGTDGKADNPKRPTMSILVATQVIEQSLDLDFDVMYSDVAPVDLVLQRAGRLHRHERANRGDPCLWLITPKEKEGKPDFGPSEWVYARFVLLRSLAALVATPFVNLPSDLESLIEQAYGAVDLPEDDSDLAESHAMMARQREEQCLNAMEVSIDYPDGEVLESQSARLDEDDPSVNPKIQAATRDTEPTVQLVLVYHLSGKDYLDTEGKEPFDEGEVPNVNQMRRLLLNEVTLSHKVCVFHYVKRAVPNGWKKCGMLRHHRLLRLDAEGLSQSDSFIRVDHHLGVRILRSNPTEGE